jgi:hypothetical protein
VLHLTTHTRLDRRTCGFKRQDVGDHDTYNHVSVSPDGLHLIISDAILDNGPVIIESSRASTADDWGNVREVTELTSMLPVVVGCDFGSDADTIYCQRDDGGGQQPGFEIYRLVRQ